VDQFLDERGARACRPVSFRDDVKLREEATREKHEDAQGDRRGAPWHAVLNQFLDWYNGYRHAHLVFDKPGGGTVRSPMPNSHQPAYGNKYYARFKALERQMLEEFDDPHVALLTFTASHKNDKGGWRAVCDHVRDVVNSFRPDEGRGVYHRLRDDLDHTDRWEYGIALEHHKSGYGHVHLAVFVDGEVNPSDFHGAIDTHLRLCDPAGRDAHNYHEPDGPISVKRVDPSVQTERTVAMNLERLWSGEDDVSHVLDDYNDVGNVASYLAEYVGARDDSELFDRSLGELTFRAACWATGTQRVRFSTGANEMIAADRGDDDERSDLLDGPVLIPKPGFDADADDPGETVDYGAPLEVGEDCWTLVGIGRVDEDGEQLHDIGEGGVRMVNIHDASHLDPPKKLGRERPRKPTVNAKLN
jgi:hypothetical protein